MTIIISGSTHRSLACTISFLNNIEYVEPFISKFNDGELHIQVPDMLYTDVLILHSISPPVNDNFMELLLLTDAIKRAGAKTITAIIPYLGYTRQDRQFCNFGPISISLVASMIETSGIQNIITVDLHSKSIEGFFKIRTYNIDPLPLFIPHISNIKNAIIVAPDIGSIARAKNFSKNLSLDLAVIHKIREKNTCYANGIIGDVAHKNCIIIDDIIDSTNTLCSVCDLLKTKNAKSITVCVTHAVLSTSISKYMQYGIKTYVTNTIIQNNMPLDISVISIHELLSHTLKYLGY